jgi:hypothetical protein
LEEFYMRKIMLLLAISGLTGSLWAADPWVGTWKVNIAKSTYAPTMPAPKEVTAVIREVGDKLEVNITGKQMDGSPISIKGTRPLQGGILEGPPSPVKGVTQVEAVIEPGDWIMIWLENGKQVYSDHSTVGKDGKTGRSTIRGTDANDKPYEGLIVWEKQ